jgi:hypothetical protein
MTKGWKKGVPRAESTKQKISEKLAGGNGGGFNVRINCPECGDDMNPANLSRHLVACKEATRYSQLIGVKMTSRQIKHRRLNLRNSFNLTLEQYIQLLVGQDYKCKICKQPPSGIKEVLCVDHCHATGKIRGLLCGTCNMLIGSAKEDKSILANAINYLI